MTTSGRSESSATFAGTAAGQVTTDQSPLEIPRPQRAVDLHGDLRGWELSTRIAAELTALSRTGWLSADR